MLDSEHVRHMAELGFIAVTKGDNENGMAIAKGLQQLRREYAIGHVIEALCYMNNQDWFAACKCLEQGLKVEPSNAMTWVTLTQAAKQMGDTQLAKQSVNQLALLGANDEWTLSQAILSQAAS